MQLEQLTGKRHFSAPLESPPVHVGRLRGGGGRIRLVHVCMSTVDLNEELKV